MSPRNIFAYLNKLIFFPPQPSFLEKQLLCDHAVGVSVSLSLIKLLNSLANFNQVCQKGRVLRVTNCLQVFLGLGRQEKAEPTLRKAAASAYLVLNTRTSNLELPPMFLHGKPCFIESP